MAITIILWIASTAVNAVLIAASLRWLALARRALRARMKRRDSRH